MRLARAKGGAPAGSARARPGRGASTALLALAVAAGVAAPAQAADRAEPAAAPWKFEVALYGWATGIDGNVGVGQQPTTPVNATFADVVSHLDGALMGSFIAKKDNWTLWADVVWSKLSADETVNAGTVRAEATQRLFIANAVAGYRLPVGGPGFDLSATAGYRFQRLSLDLALTNLVAPGSVSVSDSKSWLDPVFGLALQYRIDPKWFVNALADVGGFGVGSELTSQALVTVGYHWTEAWSVALGYRVLYTDYQSVTAPGSDFRYTTTIHGPLLSIAYYF